MSDEDRNGNASHGFEKSPKTRTKEIIFLGSIAGMSTIMGFSTTLAMAKKQDSHMFSKGLIASREISESGGNLAMRALGWGSLYAVSGVSLFCFAVWKLMGVHSMEEFTVKMQSIMPKVPKKENPGRSDFKTVKELVHFVLDEDKRAKGKEL